jgi:hypothetical protein
MRWKKFSLRSQAGWQFFRVGMTVSRCQQLGWQTSVDTEKKSKK